MYYGRDLKEQKAMDSWTRRAYWSTNIDITNNLHISVKKNEKINLMDNVNFRNWVINSQ